MIVGEKNMYKRGLFSSYEDLIEFLNNREIKKENIIHIGAVRTNHNDWINLIYEVGDR